MIPHLSTFLAAGLAACIAPPEDPAPTGTGTGSVPGPDTGADADPTSDPDEDGTIAPGLRLYVNEQVSEAVRAATYPSVGAEDGLVVYQGVFDADGDGVADPGAAAAVAAYLEAVAPPGATAPVCLDWEAETMTTLHEAATDGPAFGAAVDAFVGFLAEVRALRPDLRFGYYGLPLRRYWDRDDGWRARNDAIAPIIDQSDVLFVSVYDFYGDEESGTEADSAYVRENVAEALRLAGGRPVLPYVWHRYHDSNATLGGRLIGEDEFRRHVGAIFEAEHRGARAAGMVWWGADRYFAASGASPWDEVFAAEIPPGSDLDEWLDALHAERLQWLAEALAAAAP
jgi:hypothetical protein